MGVLRAGVRIWESSARSGEMRGGSQRAFGQSRRLASKDNQMLLVQRMEDSRVRRIYQGR
jgi:hypothetical protein